jgi:hypothetical protein
MADFFIDYRLSKILSTIDYGEFIGVRRGAPPTRLKRKNFQSIF